MAVTSAGPRRPCRSSVTGAAKSGSGEMVRANSAAGAGGRRTHRRRLRGRAWGRSGPVLREARAALTSCRVPPSTARAWRAPRRRMSAFRSTFQRSSQ